MIIGCRDPAAAAPRRGRRSLAGLVCRRSGPCSGSSSRLLGASSVASCATFCALQDPSLVRNASTDRRRACAPIRPWYRIRCVIVPPSPRRSPDPVRCVRRDPRHPAVLLHANVRWRLRPLASVVSTTEFHPGTTASVMTPATANSPRFLPIFDLIFVTYHMPPDARRALRRVGSRSPGWWAQLKDRLSQCAVAPTIARGSFDTLAVPFCGRFATVVIRGPGPLPSATRADRVRRSRGRSEALYRRHSGWITARPTAPLRHNDLVDHAVQDTFLAAWRGAKRFRGAASRRVVVGIASAALDHCGCGDTTPIAPIVGEHDDRRGFRSRKSSGVGRVRRGRSGVRTARTRSASGAARDSDSTDSPPKKRAASWRCLRNRQDPLMRPESQLARGLGVERRRDGPTSVGRRDAAANRCELARIVAELDAAPRSKVERVLLAFARGPNRSRTLVAPLRAASRVVRRDGSGLVRRARRRRTRRNPERAC